MNLLDILLSIFVLYFLSFSIMFLLYQFDKIKLKETTMIHWCRINAIIETLLLILTRFFDFGQLGAYGLGTFYVLNIILLIMQMIYAEFGAGRKFLDFLWIVFYVLLFMVDVCDVSIAQIIGGIQSSEDYQAIDTFLKDSFLGKLIIGIVTPIIRGLIVEAINKTE